MNFLSLSNAHRVVTALLSVVCSVPLCGEGWVQTAAPITNWSSITCSADGTRIAATVANGPIYVSTDAGFSWNQTAAPIADWQSIAGSADGRVLAAWAWVLRSAEASKGAVYVSTNWGVSWGLSSMPEDAQMQLAVSADGSRIAACWSSTYPTLGGRVYLSADSGASWVSKPADYGISSMAFSADGTTLALSAAGSINVSTNFGDSWYGVAGGKFASIALSSDASTILVAGRPLWDFWLHSSTNSGQTWTRADVPPASWFPAVSADGRKWVAGGMVDDFGMVLYTSTNAGATWVEGRFPLKINTFCVSADGNRIAAAGPGTGILILQSTPNPHLEISGVSDAIKLAWVVPSSPFTLQQSAAPATCEWVDVGEEAELNYTNLRHEVRVPAGLDPMFFRLTSR